MKHPNEYQSDGFVSGCNTKALSECNRQLNSARNATPEAIRHKFRSSIRYIPKDKGYLWVWFIH